MRSIAQLDAIPSAKWTEEEAYAHTRNVFDGAVRSFPDLMEPYLILLGGLAERDQKQEQSIMRRGLRETFKARWQPAG